MSAQPRETTTSDATADDVPPDINAYAIDIPEGFVAAYPTADTVAEALRLAEQAPAHDAADTEDRECPRCSSVRIKRKTGADSQQTHATDFVCTHCRTHFDDPEHPETADIVFSDDQTQLGRWADE
jgi:DNA-directed RNA polymerase subunit RPC12/RpoP